jgi:hypothetical protein
MTRYQKTLMFVVIVLRCAASTVRGAPIFYLSNDPIGVATPPDPTDTHFVQPADEGVINLFVTTDVRLSSIRLNVTNTGSGIEFTDLDVLNPNNRWVFIGGPQVIQSHQILDIGGGAIPGLSGNGVGPGSPDPGFNPTSGYLIATLGYSATENVGGTSELFIKIGTGAVSDWEGNPPAVRLGGPNHDLTPGGVPLVTDSLLDFRIRVVPEPCSTVLVIVGLLCWSRNGFRGGDERSPIARNSYARQGAS